MAIVTAHGVMNDGILNNKNTALVVPQQPLQQQQQVLQPNDHDVSSGRGENIAHHPGNERFRTLVTTRADCFYCTTYLASEKWAVVEETIRHIQSLSPPGCFLKKRYVGNKDDFV